MLKLLTKLAYSGVKYKCKGHCTAVVPAAGASERMGGRNKLLLEIDGVPVIVHTLRALEACKEIDEIILVASEDMMSDLSFLIADYGIKKVSQVVRGGETRLESVYNGVLAVSSKTRLVAVHDGARPFVTPELVKAVVNEAAKTGAAAPAVPIKDTVKTVENYTVTDTPDRKKLYAIQTPQVFYKAVISAALKNAYEKSIDVTDDCMAAEAIGMSIRVTEGSEENIKITTPLDMVLARAIYEARAKK